MNKVKSVTKSLDKKVHVCDVCKKGLKYKSHLTRHMLVHTGKKDFQCDTCSKSFARKSDLTRHLANHSE